MSRKDAMLRLHQRLVAQREELRLKLAEDMDLTESRYDGTNDLGETATQMETSELHSQLAALESRELEQIELAIDKIRLGTYGQCDRCSKSIPIARLRALPFSTTCVECQTKRERMGHDEAYEANWSSALDFERRSVDRELNMSDIDLN